jgi:hypothetical protein
MAFAAVKPGVFLVPDILAGKARLEFLVLDIVNRRFR